MLTWFWLPTATRMRILPRSPSTKVAEYTTRGRATWWSQWWSINDYDNVDDDHNEDILKNQSFAVSVDFETSIWTPPEVTDWYYDKEGNLIFNEYLLLAPLSPHIWVKSSMKGVYLSSFDLLFFYPPKFSLKQTSGFHVSCFNLMFQLVERKGQVIFVLASILFNFSFYLILI